MRFPPFSQEPAVYIALADAVVVLAITFGAPISPEQKGALDAVISVCAGVFIRSQVTPGAAPQGPPATPVGG